MVLLLLLLLVPRRVLGVAMILRVVVGPRRQLQPTPQQRNIQTRRRRHFVGLLRFDAKFACGTGWLWI
jgi:hypothetical protein